MTEECDHDLIMSSCSKCGKNAKVILLNTFIDHFIEDCEENAVMIGTSYYVPLAKIRRMEKWKE
jgi:hypothetical protein